MKRLLPLLLAATFSAAVASPTSPVVVAGQATFHQQGNVFTITNTPNTIINWQSFSVAPGEVTRFVQQSASSAVLNRILGQDPTQILGALQSNGQVFLINPNGVMFGKDARIDVAGLTASTLNLTDADFLAGRRNFAAGPAAGNISNRGAISAQPGGHVFLVAPNVENTGIITAPNGDVVLAAGRQVQLVDSRDPDMHVVVSAPEDKAINLGQVISQGGRIGIYGALVRQRGEVNANSAVVGQHGKIVLKASGDTMLEEGSKTTATGAGNGGSVHILGNRVAMTGNASVDVSGGANGGTVLMGGDYKGSNPLYASAQQTWMGKDASITADAGFAGKGGKVILWATDATRAFGDISARGGAVSGDGGFIETSADYLDVNGLSVNTRALNGKNGVWLLDPLNITVGLPNCSGVDICFSAADARVFANVPDVTGLISVSTLLAAGSDIILQAKNNIRFNDAIATGATSITANAGNSIYVDAPLTTTGGAIRLIANDPMSGTPSGNGGVYVNNHLRSNGGEITLTGKELALASTGSIDSGAANVNFTVDRLTLGSYVNAGPVTGSNLVTIMPFSVGRPIVMGSSPSSNLAALYLTNGELGNLHASQIRIGDATNTSSITWEWPGIYSSEGTRTLSLRTSGIIKVSNLIELQDPASHLELHSGSLDITGSGSLKAANVTLRADRMAIGGAVKGTSAIKVLAGSTSQHIQLGGTPGTEYSLKLDNTELAQLVSPNLYIGDSTMTGGVNIDDMTFTHAGAGKLTVDAGATNIHVDGYATTSGALVLKAGTGIYQAAPTGTESVAITTPHLQLVGNGSANANFNLTNGVNMIDMLTGSGLRDLHVLNGKDLVIGDGTTGLQYAGSLDYNGLQVALTDNGKLTIKDSIFANNGHIDIEAGSVQLGLPLDSAGISSGTATATIQAGSVMMELRGADGLSLSKGSLIAANYVDLETDKFQLEQGAQIKSPSVSGHFKITPYSDMVKINLGSGATDISTTGLVTLGLSEIELQAIDTSYISIGDYVEGEPGLVSVVGSLNLSAAPRLESLSIFLGAAGMDIRSGASLIGTRTVNIESVYPSTRAGAVLVNGLLEARKTETMSDQTVHSVGNIWIEATAVRGTGLIKSGFVTLDTTEGIGTSTVPLDLQVFGLWAQNTQYGTAGAPINLRNNYNAATPNHLMVSGLHQYGDGVGSISLETWGGMTIVDQNSSSEPATATVSTTISTATSEPTVHTKSGAISLVTHSPLNVEGIVESTSGSISLKAADGGTLTVTSTGKVQSETGNITLEATTLNVSAGSVSTAGTVTLTGTVTPTGPTLAECLATPAITGCATVLDAALDACIVDKTGSYCSQVLPTMTMCIADETTKGCSVVLPTLEQCLANRTAVGCSVVLPTTAECAATPSLPGCVVSGPTLEQCIANPSISGCSSVLPPLAVCVADKSTPGCEAVLPDLSQCIADKTLGGCEAVLPNLAQCIADKTAPGCGVVLPSLEACIANKATAGCEAVLPNLAACVADKSLPGCQVVLPDLAACIADKTAPGCDTVLPNMAACIADKTTPGCEVILPSLAACIADKNAPGCVVVLPTIAACVANKATAGCEVVLPNLAACIADKTAAGCEVVLPTIAACVANKATAGCEVVLPNLAACVADKTAAGCEVVLPNLAACVADKTTPGCEVVLPAMAACIANKATAGCEAVLPPLTVCIASPSTAGCEVVLPTIAQCVVNPTLGGCSIVLPTLEQCVANKSRPGCEIILPTLAECIGSPSLGGCSVILPKLEQCAVNPNLPGCEAVLPKPDFCATHPTDPTCQIFSPGSGQQGGQEKAPVTEAVQTSVTLVSKTPQPQAGAPSGSSSTSTGTGTGSGSEQSQGQQQGEPEKQAEKEQGTAAADNTGVKNEKPATKTYCN